MQAKYYISINNQLKSHATNLSNKYRRTRQPFIESVKEIFGERELKIVVEDVVESIESKEALLDSLFGSWESEETGDELVKMIYSNQYDSPRDIVL